MKTLLLGANGQVGCELRQALAPIGEVKACDRQTVDLERQDVLRAAIRDYRPKLIVNAAAYTAVDKAEADPDTAKRVNADAVAVLATEAKRLDAVLVHYSTEYVFDGTKPRPYTEVDTPNPLNVYGRTKLEGEVAIRDSGCRHFILRTSWVYTSWRVNFLYTILRAAQERDTLNVVAGQRGAPTSARLIAQVSVLGIHNFIHTQRHSESILGTYNLCAAGESSRYELACYFLGEAQKHGIRLRCSPENILPIDAAKYPLSAKRPTNSLLSAQKFISTFSVHLPEWRTDIQHIIQEFSRTDTAS